MSNVKALFLCSLLFLDTIAEWEIQKGFIVHPGNILPVPSRQNWEETDYSCLRSIEWSPQNVRRKSTEADLTPVTLK